MDALALAHWVKEDYAGTPDYEKGGVELSFRYAEGVLYVLTRGTDQFRDWSRNLMSWPYYQPGVGWVARGFMKGAKAVWPRVLEEIKKYDALGTKVSLVFCGHSKGGAEACDLAALAVYAGYWVLRIVTFGAPKPGRLTNLQRIDIQRYVYGMDPVPYVAPWRCHPRVPIKLDRKFGLKISDHGIENYITALSVN